MTSTTWESRDLDQILSFTPELRSPSGTDESGSGKGSPRLVQDDAYGSGSGRTSDAGSNPDAAIVDLLLEEEGDDVDQTPAASPSSGASSMVFEVQNAEPVAHDYDAQLRRWEAALQRQPFVPREEVSFAQAVVPVGREALTKDNRTQMNHLEAAFQQPPRPGDSQRRNTFAPLYTAPVPRSWQQKTPNKDIACSSRFYANATLDVLFYMFYFYEGTVAQITAAQVLRARNWRYHKALKAWIQRLEIPKVQTADYERGNYKIWDSDSWSERIKRDYHLEYRYLENGSLTRWPQLRT